MDKHSRSNAGEAGMALLEERLRQHVTALTGIGSRFTFTSQSAKHVSLDLSHPEAKDRKLDYLRGCLSELGYHCDTDSFPAPGYDGLEGTNLYARRASDASAALIEVGAHFDTLGTTGADDNCSGVAGVLELARLLRDEPVVAGIRFCLYDLEELGFLGSAHHVQTMKEPVRLAIILESVGYTSTEPNSQRTPLRIPLVFNPPRVGDFICLIGNNRARSSRWIKDYEQHARAADPQLKTFSIIKMTRFLRDAVRSDHKPYWDAGIDAIMLTDTADFRNPNYHTGEDAVEALDFAFLASVTSRCAQTLCGRAIT